jgi:hypothetical protein
MIKIKTCYTVANPKFSLKDSNAEFSAIRMRVFINKVRLNIHLPAEYKIKPCHWDNATGRAIEDPKRNPNLKGRMNKDWKYYLTSIYRYVILSAIFN